MTHARSIVLAVVAAAVLATCGVPSDDEPRAIEAANVPFGLLSPTAEATTTTQPSAFTATTRVTIYLTTPEGTLRPVQRQVEAPSSVERAITSLLGGPTEGESSRLATAITSDTELLSVQGPENGLVIIDLSRELLSITGRQQILALAQVVWTATSLPFVDRVLFEFEGEPAEVPNENGTLTSAPLGSLSYRNLVGR